MNNFIDYKCEGLHLHQTPFPHFTISSFVSIDLGNSLLDWLDSDAKWGFRSVNDFYETYDLDLRHFTLPGDLEFLKSDRFIGQIRYLIETNFEVQLSPKHNMTAQKMVTGHRIGLHTDHGPVGQSHRFLIQLNRGWSLEQGGLLMLFDEEFPTEPSPSHLYYPPQHLSALAFEISPKSFHGVSRVITGTRYTLAYSFYRDPKLSML